MFGTNTGPLDPPGFAPTGRAIDVHGMDLVRMEDGRIADYRAFYDMQGLAQPARARPAARLARAARARGTAAARREGQAPMSDHYDVAIAGASVAGCTAARLYAQAGLRVALIEKRPKIDAHKTVCTHYIQASATPVIERLGLIPLLEERGAIRNSIDVWTEAGGWIEDDGDHPARLQRHPPHARPDPAPAGGRDAGGRADRRIDRGRPPRRLAPRRVRARGPPARAQRSSAPRSSSAPTGVGSRIARMAAIPGRARPHNRFFYWGYYRDVRPGGTKSRMWLGDPDAAYTFPNEDGLSVVLVAPGRARRDEFKADPEAAFLRALARLPDGPDLSHAEREGKLVGKLDMPNVWRPAGKDGLALIGDAAQASDPLWGVGCGWAFQSAEWLVDATTPALVAGGEGLDAGLRRYRRRHLLRLGPHHLMLSDIASGRPPTAFERMLYRAAARDPKVRKEFEAVGAAPRHARPDVPAGRDGADDERRSAALDDGPVGRLGRGGRQALGRRRLLAGQRALELADPLAQRAARLGQLLGSEDHQRDDRDEHDLHGSDVRHRAPP